MALSIGNFDGVHRGHQALIECLKNFKRSQPHPENFQTVVLSFEPHPREVLQEGHLICRLSPPKEKKRLLEAMGVDQVKSLAFTQEFSKIPAREFFENYLIKDMDVAFLAVGHNFYFGHNREGSPGKIIDWCEERGIAAELCHAVESDGDFISSTRIRKLISNGEVAKASRLLGRDYFISGEVQHGDKRGKRLGFPTANLIPPINVSGAPCLPNDGVYVSIVTVEGKTFPAVTNVGRKPTIQKICPLTVESHLLDFDGDLYGKLITVEFRDRLRAEKKFDSLEQLVAQIAKDIEVSRNILGI